MLSWNPGKHRTAAKHPIAFNVAVWNFWKRKSKQTSAIWTVNPIRNKAKGKWWWVVQGTACTVCPLGF